MKTNSFLILMSMLWGASLFGQTNQADTTLALPDGLQAVVISRGAVTNAPTSVKPGDHLDLVATCMDRVKHHEVTQPIIENVLVIAVTQGQAGETSVTLAIKPEQVKLVNAADRAGALSLFLLPPHKDQPAPTFPPGVGDYWLRGEGWHLRQPANP